MYSKNISRLSTKRLKYERKGKYFLIKILYLSCGVLLGIILMLMLSKYIINESDSSIDYARNSQYRLSKLDITELKRNENDESMNSETELSDINVLDSIELESSVVPSHQEQISNLAYTQIPTTKVQLDDVHIDQTTSIFFQEQNKLFKPEVRKIQRDTKNSERLSSNFQQEAKQLFSSKINIRVKRSHLKKSKRTNINHKTINSKSYINGRNVVFNQFLNTKKHIKKWNVSLLNLTSSHRLNDKRLVFDRFNHLNSNQSNYQLGNVIRSKKRIRHNNSRKSRLLQFRLKRSPQINVQYQPCEYNCIIRCVSPYQSYENMRCSPCRNRIQCRPRPYIPPYTPKPTLPPGYSNWVGPVTGCHCNPFGSEIHTCDIVTGQCTCKANFTGRTCDTCLKGHWLLENTKCVPCNCDPSGSLNENCDMKSGQCYCKYGITGKKCNTCLTNYYGFSKNGCKECDHCDKPGHFCDPDTGRCICPPFSHGEFCNRCIPNSWGFEPSKGCKPCKCDEPGSLKSQCNSLTGTCTCRKGYTGNKCQKCEIGYWGYPHCRRCNCNLLGTVLDHCDMNTGMCQCNNDNGQCRCKANVVGRSCDQCQKGTIGLEKNNHEGCTRCFCFGRSTHCTDSGLTWGKIKLKWSRMLELRREKYGSQNISYILQTIATPPSKYAFNQNTTKTIRLHNSELKKLDGKYIIPKTDGNITIGIHRFFHGPFYWNLPTEFLGDRILSYGGYLKFITTTENITKTFSPKILNKHPKVIIKGNNIILGCLPILDSLGSNQEVRFHETLWTVLNAPDIKLINKSVTRELMMVVLQNIQNIFLRATNAEYFSKAVLHEVLLETAIHIDGQPPPLAKGIELCECPEMYNSSSCQNPSIGFFRSHNKPSPNGTIIINLIGEAKPCECNGRSTICDTETGYCLNCINNTAGRKCEVCAEGFYGNPNISKCIPCSCPTKDRNFARTCERSSNKELICKCKEGYTGKYCDRCSFGYYGYPSEKDGYCKPCNCNIYGRASEECDEHTGQCNCKPGIVGRDCTLCEKSRHMLQNNQCIPCDNCTQWLLTELDILEEYVINNHQHLDIINIPPPNGLLDIVENKTLNLKTSLEKQNELKNNIMQIPNKPFLNLGKNSKKLEHKIKKLLKKSIGEHTNSQHINNKSDNLYKDVNNINKEVSDITAELDVFGEGDKHLNTMSAIKEAQEILEKIRNIDFSITIDNILQKIDKCSELLADITEFKEDIDDFYKRINDMDAIIRSTLIDIKHVNDLLKENNNNLSNLIELNDNIYFLIDDIKTMYMPETDYIDAKSANNKSREIIHELRDNKKILENIIEQYQKKENVTNNLRNKVQEAEEYANNLLNQAINYRELFKQTKNGADYALQASQTYQNIVDSINRANITTHEAYNIFINNVNIFESEDSLNNKISLLLFDLDKIQKQAQNQLNKIKDFKEIKLKNINESFKSLKENFWETGSHDNNISQELERLKSNINTTMKIIIDNFNEESASLKIIFNKAKQIQDNTSYKLQPALDDLNTNEANKSVTLSRASENLTEAQTMQQKLNETLISYETMIQNQSNTVNELMNSLANESQTLKDKVEEARRIANTINLPLTNADQDCIRIFNIYSSSSSLKTSTSISFIISMKSDVQNSSIIYIGGTTQQFIAIEMVNKKIRLVWNLGDDTGILTHPEEIKNSTVNSGYYYIVEAKIIFNVGELQIRKMYSINGTNVNENSFETLKVTNKTNHHYIIFDSGSNNELWVGGTPSRIQDFLLNDQGLKVSIYKLVLDEHPIGLWNYINKTGNCESNIYWTDPTENEYQFSGDGFSANTLKMDIKKASLIVDINFRTFDENALILAIISPRNDSYVSIYLEGGKVVWCIQYINESKLEISTNKKYNTGEEIHITIRRLFRNDIDRSLMKVNTEVQEGSKQGNNKMLPNFLRNAKYFIGGVPPTFKKIYKNFTVHSISKQKSFMGCMRDIVIVTESLDPVNSEHYGVKYSCSNKLYNKIGFFGNGYTKINRNAHERLESFSFVFVTDELYSHIATIVFKLENEEEEHIQFTINNGKIQVNIAANHSSEMLLSEETYNDKIFHVVSLQNNDKLIFQVDNSVMKSPLHAINRNIHKIYFGKNCTTCTHALKPFKGTIKDVILNNKFIYFNQNISFSNVTIGRDGPVDVILPVTNIPYNTPATNNLFEIGCNKMKNYSIESGAGKFGDTKHSYVKHPFHVATLWHKDFMLELEFRTFEPNGMLYISPGFKEKKPYHLLVEIKNSNVYLTAKSKKQNYTLHTTSKVNDGKWHKLIYKNEHRKWSLIVDNEIKNLSKKGPRKLTLTNIIYIGGVAHNEKRLSNKTVNGLIPFKGCIKNFKVNSVNTDLVVSKNENVRQCFTSIERGSYFSGDAFALYKHDFLKTKQVNITLEFKSPEINGVLVTSTDSIPEFSIELTNGKVIVSLKLSNNSKPLSVIHTPTTQFSLCDNRWHTIRAQLSKNQIIIEVDKKTTSVSNKSNMRIDLNSNRSPLYIGGLPDTAAQSSLQTRENFKGCIKNIHINEDYIDWVNMEKLHNILLDSCPVV